ncbi:MAG: hypothetical protein Ct9H300mP4_12960 [Gammaproteobacteria bacterium]|nr:MAG: hypothetical protein Ct9H300mP4_12960 [Gammaproteobacteria bacterium]
MIEKIDVTDMETFKRWLTNIKTGIDVLINNAGISEALQIKFLVILTIQFSKGNRCQYFWPTEWPKHFSITLLSANKKK